MSHRLLIAPFLLFFVAAAAADDWPAGVDVADKLLHLQAPAPPGGPQTRPSVPDEHASVDALVDYWVGGPFGDDFGMRPPANNAIREKLLQGALKDPIYLPRLVYYLPETPQAADDIKRLYDKLAALPETTEEWKGAVRNWLMMNSRYFRGDLVAAARGVKTVKDQGIQNENALRALAQLDWAACYPLLIGYERSDSSEVATIAKVIRFEHAVAMKDAPARDAVGARLEQIARDETQVPDIRRRAIDALFAAQWPARDGILRQLMVATNTWQRLPGRDLFNGSPSGPTVIPADAIAADPDHYIPVLTQLLADPNPSMRWGAAGVLLLFPKPDVLRRILPLVAEEKNLDEFRSNALLSVLVDIDVPQSRAVLHQIFIAGHADAGLLARAMIRQNSPDAVAALRTAVETKHDNDFGRRDDLLRMLVDRGGIPIKEIASVIEAYAVKAAASEAQNGGGGGLFGGGGGGGGLFDPSESSSPERRGQELATAAADSTGVADLLLDRANLLRAKQSKVTEKIWEIVAPWSDPAVDRRLLARLRDEPLDLPLAQLALARPESMRKNEGAALKKLLAVGGFRAGLAAALLGDADATTAVLNSADAQAIRMLLACGRLMRTPLAVAAVQRLFDRKNPMLSAAAERFLIVDDSPEARRIVLARHPGQAMILGADWGFFANDDGMDRGDENALRDQVRQPSGPAEVFALQHYGMGYWEDRTVITFLHDQATLDVEPTKGKHLIRTLTEAERRALLGFMANNNVDDLKGIDTPVTDGSDYAFVHVTRARGRRIFMHNPGEVGTANTVHHHLIKLFERLENRGRFQTHYSLQDTLRDATVAWSANPAQHIRAVWKHGDDFRVLVEPDEDNTWESIDHYHARWRALRDGKIAEAVPAPAGVVVRTEPDDDNALGVNPYSLNETRWWRGIVDDGVIRAGDSSKPETAGIWRCRAGQKPQRIVDGPYFDPVATLDGKWAIVERDGLFRLDLSTGKFLRCTLPDGRTFVSICCVPRGEKILVRGRKGSDEKPDDQYFLVDAETGKSQTVEGDFQPLIDNEGRRLHATSNADEFWLAYPFGGETVVELYDIRAFRTLRRLFLPGLKIHGDAIAIDNAEGAVYVAVCGDLLRIPLTNAVVK